jgi:hypothetical protein
MFIRIGDALQSGYPVEDRELFRFNSMEAST